MFKDWSVEPIVESQNKKENKAVFEVKGQAKEWVAELDEDL